MNAPAGAKMLEQVSVILPVMTEKDSLVKTVDIILRDCAPHVREFIIVVCERTGADSIKIVRELGERLPNLVVVHHQKLPFLGGAIREAFDLARGSHVIMMASDLETNPESVAQMIDEARKRPDAIVTASRWRRGGKFQGYNFTKLLANWIFQRFFSLIYWTRLSDLTFGYRLFPTSLVQAIDWQELMHPFLFETIVKPLRLGVPIIEIATVWKARSEGQSQNTLMRNFLYFRCGLKARFAPKLSFLRTPE